MTLAKYIVESPAKAIEMYQRWLTLELLNRKSAPAIEFHRIVRLAHTRDVNLVCYCAPRPCHGYIVKRLIENLIP